MLMQALHCSLLKCRVHCFQPWVRPLYVCVLCYEREKVMELAWAGGGSSAAHKGIVLHTMHGRHSAQHNIYNYLRSFTHEIHEQRVYFPSRALHQRDCVTADVSYSISLLHSQ